MILKTINYRLNMGLKRFKLYHRGFGLILASHWNYWYQWPTRTVKAIRKAGKIVRTHQDVNSAPFIFPDIYDDNQGPQ